MAAKKFNVKLDPKLSEEPKTEFLDELDDFDKEEELEIPSVPEPEEPSVRTRKDAASPIRVDKKKEAPAIKPLSDFILDKKGEIRKDADGDEMRYAAGEHYLVGFVNESGVLFPNGYKFPGGHVTNGNVVLNRCPKCGHSQNVDDALSGICGNQRCKFSKHDDLENFSL